MKIKLEINNSAGCHFDKKKLELIVKGTLSETYLSSFDGEVEVSVAFVSKAEIKRLNGEYRNKNTVTDILSFANYADEKEIKAEMVSGKKELFLGELIICCDDIAEYVSKVGKDFKKEMFEVFSHGILHLLGFTHSEEMFSIQKKVVKVLG